MTLSDKDMLTTALTNQKMLASQYLATADHSAGPAYLNLLMDLCREEQQARLQIYQMMHERGWYSPQAIDQQQVHQARQSFDHVRRQIHEQINQVTQESSSWGSAGHATGDTRGQSWSWGQGYGRGQQAFGQSHQSYGQQTGQGAFGQPAASTYARPSTGQQQSPS